MDLNKKEILKYISKYDDNILFNIKKVENKNIMSRAQQKFYWGVVVDIISNFHGMTPVETHLAIKTTFNIETTTDLSTSEFKTLIEMIQDLWENKFNVKIPNPRDIKGEESLFNSLGF